MTDYLFDGAVVIDPTTLLPAPGLQVTIYDALDTSNSTPLALRDSSGAVLANPVTSSDLCSVPPMILTDARQYKAVASNGATILVASYKGIIDELQETKDTIIAQMDATYAPGAPPAEIAAAGAFKGGYNRATNVYNAKPGQLRRFRAALAKAMAGTGSCTIVDEGESTTAGLTATVPWQQSWPAWVLEFLAKYGYPVAPNKGPAVAHTNLTDTRWTLGAGWGAFQAYSNLVFNDSTTEALTFTAQDACTRITVRYSDASAPFTVQIDGGAVETVTPGGSFAMGFRTWTVPNTAHTVTIRRVSGAVFIHSVEAYNDTPRVRLVNAAISGAVSASLTDNTWPSITAMAAGTGAAEFNADLVTIQIMINDKSAAVPAATWKANVLTAVNANRANGADVLLITTCPARTPGGTTPAEDLNFTDYRIAAYELADELDVPLLDMHDRWGSFQEGQDLGLYWDVYHPHQAGLAEEARAVITAVGL